MMIEFFVTICFLVPVWDVRRVNSDDGQNSLQELNQSGEEEGEEKKVGQVPSRHRSRRVLHVDATWAAAASSQDSLRCSHVHCRTWETPVHCTLQCPHWTLQRPHCTALCVSMLAQGNKHSSFQNESGLWWPHPFCSLQQTHSPTCCLFTIESNWFNF